VGTRHVAYAVMSYYASYRFEKVHPLQCGIFRRKNRTARRPGMPRENPLVFHLRRAWEIASTYLGFAWYCLKIDRLRKRIERETAVDDQVSLSIARARLPLSIVVGIESAESWEEPWQDEVELSRAA